jgi:gliotoxin/aspirochlorine biosynthesis gamma-glutamylcyclotransferase
MWFNKMGNDKKVSILKVGAFGDKPLWYLGYGSNMKASSMNDRNITPLATKIVNVPTHYVTFDVFGIPYSEPCYASIEEFPDGRAGKLQLIHRNDCFQVPSLCGVAHLLTPSDFHRLFVTEGSGVVYDIVEVQAYELDKNTRAAIKPFVAFTLKAKWPQRPNGTPSARYIVRSQ